MVRTNLLQAFGWKYYPKHSSIENCEPKSLILSIVGYFFKYRKSISTILENSMSKSKNEKFFSIESIKEMCLILMTG